MYSPHSVNPYQQPTDRQAGDHGPMGFVVHNERERRMGDTLALAMAVKERSKPAGAALGDFIDGQTDGIA